MARMIPQSPLDTESRAEIRLFERLRDDLPNEIVAFHSVAWQRDEVTLMLTMLAQVREKVDAILRYIEGEDDGEEEKEAPDA